MFSQKLQISTKIKDQLVSVKRSTRVYLASAAQNMHVMVQTLGVFKCCIWILQAFNNTYKHKHCKLKFGIIFICFILYVSKIKLLFYHFQRVVVY